LLIHRPKYAVEECCSQSSYIVSIFIVSLAHKNRNWHNKKPLMCLSMVCPTWHTWDRCWRTRGGFAVGTSPRSWYSNCIIIHSLSLS